MISRFIPPASMVTTVLEKAYKHSYVLGHFAALVAVTEALKLQDQKDLIENQQTKINQLQKDSFQRN